VVLYGQLVERAAEVILQLGVGRLVSDARGEERQVRAPVVVPPHSQHGVAAQRCRGEQKPRRPRQPPRKGGREGRGEGRRETCGGRPGGEEAAEGLGREEARAGRREVEDPLGDGEADGDKHVAGGEVGEDEEGEAGGEGGAAAAEEAVEGEGGEGGEEGVGQQSERQARVGGVDPASLIHPHGPGADPRSASVSAASH